MMSLALALVMSLSLCIPAFAFENTETTSAESQPITILDTGEAKIVTGDTVTKIARGYAAKQPTQGYKFDSYNMSGGSLYYSESGGSTTTLSFTLSYPYGPVSVGIGVDLGIGGNNSSIGQLVPVKDGYGYYKIYVERAIAVSPKTAYYRVGTGAPWELEYTYHTEEVVWQHVYAEKVSSL